MALPVLLWGMGMALGYRARHFSERAILGYNVLIFSILIFIFGANIFLYEEWHTPLNNRAIAYFKTPAAMLDSMSLAFKLGCVAAYVLFTWLWWRIYRIVVGLRVYPPTLTRWHALWLPALLGLLMLGIRGGLGVMPINESAVYYSPHLFNNHAATNTFWHLVHSLVETRSTKNHFQFMPDDEAESLYEYRMHGMSGETIPDNWWSDSLTTKPNVVFIIMESMTAQVIEELGGQAGVCPNLSALIHEGILFDSVYSSGYRTDQGLVSVLAGYPAQPDQSIVLLDDKAATLPSLPRMLRDSGYSTLYVYGGELTFANIGVWLTHQQFSKILSEKDFPSEAKTQRWGVDDHHMLQRSLEEIAGLKPPFFATLMTLSLHPPYDVPYESAWNGASDPEKFRHSAAFADYAIGEFFKAARQQAWYDNTLFVLVADHGNSMPGGLGMDQPESRHLPLIIFHPHFADHWKGKRISLLANHHDIPATVGAMLGLKAYPLPWSRNLWFWETAYSAYPQKQTMRFAKGFAYYANENGLGWIDPSGQGFYRFQDRDWQWYGAPLDSTARSTAKAYLQTLYDDFLRR